MKSVIQDLKSRLLRDPTTLPSWLYVVPDSKSQIIVSLNYWDNFLKTTEEALAHYHFKKDSWTLESFPGWLREHKGKNKEAQRDTLADFLASDTPDSRLAELPEVPPHLSVEQARKFVKKNRHKIADEIYSSFDKGLMGSMELRWFEQTNVLLPPPE